MKDYCPLCGKLANQNVIKEVTSLNIRGEAISVEIEYTVCEACGEDYETPHEGYDPLDAAYREYRRRNGMLQPEEIKQYRKTLGLTQVEFSKKLGIGYATLNRYENGALQSPAHDKLIRLFVEHELQKPETDPCTMSTSEASIRSADYIEFLLAPLMCYKPDQYNGFTPFDFQKVVQLIKFLTEDSPVSKTKLLKQLSYCDFLQFKHQTVSITGCHYAHADFGPIPDQFRVLLLAAQLTNEVVVDEVVGTNFEGELYRAATPPDLGLFTPQELEIITQVKTFFKDYKTKQICDYSHQEEGYLQTESGELISYKYAHELRI